MLNMNDRPTPETDAVTMQPVDRLARAYTFHGTEPFKYSTKELVPAEVARKLERARDEAQEALRTLAEHGENEIQKLIKECDEARNKMADALQEADLRTLDYERMKQERDEAREAKRLDGAYEDATNYYARMIELIDERAEARDIAENLSKQGLDMMDENRFLKQELDKARKEVEYYKARYDVLKESW